MENQHITFMSQVGLPLTEDTLREMDALVKTLDSLNAAEAALRLQLNASQVRPGMTTEEINKELDKLNQLKSRALTLREAVDRVVKSKPNIEAVQKSLYGILDSARLGDQLAKDYAKAYVAIADSVKNEIGLLNGPMPQTRAWLDLTQQYVKNYYRVLQGDEEGARSGLQALYSLIEIYTSPAVLEAQQYYDLAASPR